MNPNDLIQLKKFESQNRIFYRIGLTLVFLVLVIWAFMAVNKQQLNQYITSPGKDAKIVLARYEKTIPQTEQEKNLLEENKALIAMNGIIFKVLPLSFFIVGLLVFGMMMIGISSYQQTIIDFTKNLVSDHKNVKGS